ncbi:MAG TPA: hypothetical protein VFA10_16665 [Ktedonobacteraceae bacterium]|nr:hypothetical protein [Ktedonobacteraceae bacterium]
MMQNRDTSAPNASIQKRRVMAVTLFLRDYRIAREELRRGASIMIGNRWTDSQVIATEAQFHNWFIGGLNRKINTRGGILAERGKWRKWDQDYQGRLWAIIYVSGRYVICAIAFTSLRLRKCGAALDTCSPTEGRTKRHMVEPFVEREK